MRGLDENDFPPLEPQPFVTEEGREIERLRAELAATQKQRDKLQAHFDADEEDRRQYIEAWANWIELKSELPIAEWLHAYAAAIPHPPRDGDEAKNRIWIHLDQRMRDAAEMIDTLQKGGEL